MGCLEDIHKIVFPKDLVYNLTKLYNFKGKDFYYEDVFKQYMAATVKNTVEEDTLYAAKLLNLDITDARLKLLIKKDSNPKDKKEEVVKNLKRVFEIIQEKGTDLELTDNEFDKLATRIFGERNIQFAVRYEPETYGILTEKKKISKRDRFKLLLQQYKAAITTYQIEPTQAITSMFIDVVNEEVYSKFNDFLALLILYSLLVSQRFNVFKYVSFFKLVFTRKDDFNSAVVSSSRKWEINNCNTSILNNFIIDVMLESYAYVDKMIDDYHFDKKLSKQDNVETIIMKMPPTFSKEEVMLKCPSLSESTIRRALEKLRKEGKISPTGTGRSAKWIKNLENEMFTPETLQTSIFDFVGKE